MPLLCTYTQAYSQSVMCGQTGPAPDFPVQSHGELNKAHYDDLISQVFLLNFWVLCQSAAGPNYDRTLWLTHLLVFPCLFALSLLLFFTMLLDLKFYHAVLHIKFAPSGSEHSGFHTFPHLGRTTLQTGLERGMGD